MLTFGAPTQGSCMHHLGRWALRLDGACVVAMGAIHSLSADLLGTFKRPRSDEYWSPRCVPGGVEAPGNERL